MEKRVTYIAVLLLIFSQNLFASILTFDESYFDSLFNSPIKTIDFSTLKDGSSYSEVLSNLNSNPLSVGYYFANEVYIYENAWTNDLYIRGKQGGGYNIATWWDGNSVRINDTSRNFSIYQINDALPMALNITTSNYTGFLGIIPESSGDKEYVFGNLDMRINSISYGFKSVPEPSILALIFTGIFGLGLARRKKKLSSS